MTTTTVPTAALLRLLEHVDGTDDAVRSAAEAVRAHLPSATEPTEETVVTKTVFEITVLHRTDASDHLAGEHNFENAWAESYDGNAVGQVTSSYSVPVAADNVSGELIALDNDGTFFDHDLGREDDDLDHDA